ncbi:hypothetical protein LSG23_20365 (plasmid) [Bacillus velezensis]|uniref:hypothetical protein n=1 Tax=Bacillus velezensis TaxID=492670 RepID=UPI000988062A|nr:hypothetical protein [Bacillus velezensis]AQS42440.1 hypothetical protein BVH55_00140 [Bacillus velezensis]WNR83240.1 hypothetical protein RP314_20485 [Bacillus velezensis]
MTLTKEEIKLFEQANLERYKKVYDSFEIGEHRIASVEEEDGFYDDDGELLTHVNAEIIDKKYSRYGCSARVILDGCTEVWMDAEDLI